VSWFRGRHGAAYRGTQDGIQREKRHRRGTECARRIASILSRLGRRHTWAAFGCEGYATPTLRFEDRSMTITLVCSRGFSMRM
jgi:hypothetical protein